MALSDEGKKTAGTEHAVCLKGEAYELCQMQKTDEPEISCMSILRI